MLVAAGAAAVTVVMATLLLLRPWTRAQEPTIVRLPVAAPLLPLGGAVARPASAPAPAPRSAKAPPPVAPTLDILSRPPGAHVTVDGEQLRAATPIHAEAFAPGMHHVTVEKKGYLARVLSVQLGEGERRTLDVELRAVPRAVGRALQPRGFLTVRTMPWSKVFDGARLIGTTPLANASLTAGTHTLTFVNPDFPPLTRMVEVHAGEESRLSLELKK
jgi:hypothetical protein